MKKRRRGRIIALALVMTMLMGEFTYANEAGIPYDVQMSETDGEYELLMDEGTGTVIDENMIEDGAVIVIDGSDEDISDDIADVIEADDSIIISGNSVSDDIDIISENSVSDDTVSRNTVSDNTVSVNEIFETGSDADWDEMFPGLKSVASLGSDYVEDKEEITENIAINAGTVEGQDYVEGEILVNAETRELAEEYAQAFNGELISYDFDLAVIKLNADEGRMKAAVMDAVLASAQKDRLLPAAWPNYYRYLYEDDEDPDTDYEETYDADADIMDEVTVSGNDNAMDYPSDDDEPTVFYDEDGNVDLLGAPATTVVNDPMTKPNSSMYQWFHQFVGSPYAWQAGYNGKGVKVCVIDTGVVSDHEDLKVAAKTNYNNGAGVNDADGHGTNVAGIIAAKASNGVGGCGVAYGATLYTINILRSDGSMQDSDIVNAVNYAANYYNVNIINMSLGGPTYSGALATAVKNAYNKGVAVFCAAGNESTNALMYPAGLPGAISIGAVDSNNKRTYFSNTGSVVFTGPGKVMYSTYNSSRTSYD